jgi:hypothetical protein
MLIGSVYKMSTEIEAQLVRYLTSCCGRGVVPSTPRCPVAIQCNLETSIKFSCILP